MTSENGSGLGRGVGTSWTSVRTRTGCGPVQGTGYARLDNQTGTLWGVSPVGGPPNGPVGFPVLLGFRTGIGTRRDWSVGGEKR